MVKNVRFVLNLNRSRFPGLQEITRTVNVTTSVLVAAGPEQRAICWSRAGSHCQLQLACSI